MDKFTRLTGIAAPLMRPNIDTDVIIPIDDCVSVPRAEQGRCAFRAWRYLADGRDNPDFVLNRAPFREAVKEPNEKYAQSLGGRAMDIYGELRKVTGG